MKNIIKKLDENLRILKSEYLDNAVIIDLESKSKSVKCPHCGKKYTSVHSRYKKDIKDLPLQEYKTILSCISGYFSAKIKNVNTQDLRKDLTFMKAIQE